MKKYFILLIFAVLSAISVLGQVGINTDNSTPDPSAMLDVKSSEKGLLPPRVALTATNISAPVSSPAIGLQVYNTATAGTVPFNVAPGIYSWDGTKWVAGDAPKGANVGDMQFWNGTQWVIVPAGTYGQQLFFCNGIPTWGGCPPVLTTAPGTNITYNSAVSGGNITLDGGLPVLVRGVCWSTNPDPTINGSKTTDGSGAGSFISNIAGLLTNTLYYLRSYATNSAGTGYGNELNFTTPCESYSTVSVSIVSSSNNVCAGTSVSFTATPVNGGNSPVFQWQKNGNNISGATNSTYAYNPSNADIIRCVLTSNATCTAGNPATSNPITMTVNSAPLPAGPISGNASWCYGLTYLPETGYSIAPISNATSYVWSVPFGTIIISGLGTRGIVTNAPPGMGLFSVYGTNQCGSGTPSYLSVNMYYPPNPSITGPVNVCQYSTGKTYTTESGMSNYTWTISPGGTITSGGTSTSNICIVTWNTSGAKTVKVNYNNANGCSASSQSVLNVTVNPVPETPLAGTQSASQTQIIWNWNPVAGAAGYKWNTTNDFASAIDMGTVTTKTETGLTCNTPCTRYVWAYNSCGYTTPVTLNQTTLACDGAPCTGAPTVSYSGQTYNTVQRGSQCWFKENLNVGAMIGNTLDQTNNSVVEKYCYNNLESNCAIYGGLYQWNEMMQYVTTSGLQGICPTGWHIPTDAQWTAVTDFLGGLSVAGGKMKTTGTIETGTGLWYAPNTGATNESGFSSVPAGHCPPGEPFYGIGTHGNWWSSAELSTTDAWDRVMYHNNSNVARTNNSKGYGLSVRCLRDSCIAVLAPATGANTPDPTQIIWNWGSVAGATGYKWNTANDYSTATDMGTATSKTETSLACNTAYTRYVWAYNACWNSTPVTLNQSTAACGAAACVGTPTVTYGGQTYNTVQIGSQCWFKENLNIGTMISGTLVQTNNSVVEKYCYNNLESNCAVYGGLYQWNEMMQYATTAGVQGICPTGWHIPTDAQWTAETTFLGGTSIAGGKMKSTGTIEAGTGLWHDPNTGATNESSFSAVPAGQRSTVGTFNSIGYNGVWWSSTEGYTGEAYHRNTSYGIGSVTRFDYDKNTGFSVRCLRDY